MGRRNPRGSGDDPIMTATSKPRFPGVAQRSWTGAMTFVKGTIIFESDRVQYVKPRAKFVGFWQGGLVNLIGDSYLYICKQCAMSICQYELPSLEQIRAAGVDFLQATKPHCPHCFQPLSRPKEGDKVLLHYRYEGMQTDADGNVVKPGWGAWFAERKEW
jgi:hypothetical protein